MAHRLRALRPSRRRDPARGGRDVIPAPWTARRGDLGIALAVVVVDQLTKIAAHAWLRPVGSVPILPGWFDLTYSRNRGGLFGYFADLGDPWRAMLLTALPVLAIVLLGRFLVYGTDLSRPARAGLASVLGGAIGNLIDRLVRGEVVDFLDAYAGAAGPAAWLERHFGTAHWPTFNVADSAIVVGAGLLLLDVVRPRRQRQATPAS
jgi:signal peptidase II